MSEQYYVQLQISSIFHMNCFCVAIIILNQSVMEHSTMLFIVLLIAYTRLGVSDSGVARLSQLPGLLKVITRAVSVFVLECKIAGYSIINFMLTSYVPDLSAW